MMTPYKTFDSDRQPVQVLFGQPLGPGVKGRPQYTWRSTVQRYLSVLGVALRQYRFAQDRLAQRQVVVSIHTLAGDLILIGTN